MPTPAGGDAPGADTSSHKENDMARSVLTHTLAGIAIAGMMATALAPGAAHAASPLPSATAHQQTQAGARSVMYRDAFSPAGRYSTDAQLGLKTHWETAINLSDPTSPIVWTRVQDYAPSANGAVSGAMQPAARPASGSRVRPRINNNDCGSGGAKLNDQQNYNGNCIEFTGRGTQNLAGLMFPHSCDFVWQTCTYADHAESLRTLASAASGYLQCQGSQANFGTNYQWYDIRGVDGDCNYDKGYIYSITLNT